MKIKKPEDEKYFKDIVLNEILDEISSETGAPKVTEVKKRKKHKNRFFSKTLFVTIIAILFFFFVIALFNVVDDATSEAKLLSKPATNSPLDTEDWKMAEDQTMPQKTAVPKAIKEKSIIQKKPQSKIIEINSVKPKPDAKKKTERELAKEALRLQMLN